MKTSRAPTANRIRRCTGKYLFESIVYPINSLGFSAVSLASAILKRRGGKKRIDLKNERFTVGNRIIRSGKTCAFSNKPRRQFRRQNRKAVIRVNVLSKRCTRLSGRCGGNNIRTRCWRSRRFPGTSRKAISI